LRREKKRLDAALAAIVVEAGGGIEINDAAMRRRNGNFNFSDETWKREQRMERNRWFHGVEAGRFWPELIGETLNFALEHLARPHFSSDDPARQFLLICPSTRHGIILEMRNWKRSPRTSFSIFYLKLSHGFARILRCVTEGIWMDSFSIRDRDRVSGSPENVLAQRHFVKSWKLRARRGEPKSSCVVECRIGAPEKGQTIFYVSAQWA
jgi:hypothetical protein